MALLKIEHADFAYLPQKPVLVDVNLKLEKGEILAVLSTSGAGKTTLFKGIARVLPIQTGEVYFEEIPLSTLRKKDLQKYRQQLAFLFQDTPVIEALNVLDNVMLGAVARQNFMSAYLHLHAKAEIDRALDYLTEVGLGDMAYEKADRLSGGQKQRVAIARALYQQAKLFLADEPISHLDRKTGEKILQLFHSIREKYKVSFCMNMHDVEKAKQYADRLIGIQNGRILFDQTVNEVQEKELKELYV